MVKKHFCKQVIAGEVCGAEDPSLFPPGRYSTCKACRNRASRTCGEIKHSKDKDSIANTIDPDKNIRYIIEDTILYNTFSRWQDN